MNKEKIEIPIWEKYALSIQEAEAYFNIGEKKLRKLVEEVPDAEFILWKGNRALFKRKLFERFIDNTSSI